MAEVLITLGIIGVVAAITLPTLIQNYQKQVWVNQLKKVINSIENNNRKLLADEGVDSLADSSMAKVYANLYDENVPYDELIPDLPSFYEKHFLWRQVGKNTDIYKIFSESVVFYSSDGACIVPIEGRIGSLAYFVDINCDKSPNKVGRDRFSVCFKENGLYDTECISGEPIIPNCKGYTNSSGVDDFHWLVGGYICTNEIIRDGWKMDY